VRERAPEVERKPARTSEEHKDREPHAPRPPREHAAPKRESPPPKPALEGALSLKEALSQVTGHKPAEHAPPAMEHPADLKSVLHTVAPKAEAPAHQPVELPKEVLETMLAVDEKPAEKVEADDEYGAWLRDK
jgi:hypothetical protein